MERSGYRFGGKTLQENEKQRLVVSLSDPKSQSPDRLVIRKLQGDKPGNGSEHKNDKILAQKSQGKRLYLKPKTKEWIVCLYQKMERLW